MKDKTVLSIENLSKIFYIRPTSPFAKKQPLIALNNVSFDVKENEVVGLIGESGCGKSTLARCLVGLNTPTSGNLNYRGHSLLNWKNKSMFGLRREVQMIFQDPYSSLDTRKNVHQIIEEPLIIHGIQKNKKARTEEVIARMEEVGLNPNHRFRYPHEFSGGQRQRINIARALILKPKLIICDEPVSALDVSVQAQVLNLFLELQEKHSLVYLFISHDLSVIKHLSDRIVIMYLGNVVEISTAGELYQNPLHPYTKALLSAVPPESPFQMKHEVRLKGELKSAVGIQRGCPLYARCHQRMEKCEWYKPRLMASQNKHQVACFIYHDQKEKDIALI